MESKRKPRLYKFYTEEERPKKFAKLKLELPDILERLAKLPRATGESDQAQEQVMDFHSVWKVFRIEAMRCGAKEWLTKNIYSTADWANRNALKQSATAYRKWKKGYDAEHYRNLSEDAREQRRRRDRDRYAKEARDWRAWFDFDRVVALATRCVKRDQKAEAVSYQPVVNMLKKHIPTDRMNWAKERVLVAIRCLQWNPEDDATERKLSMALKFSGMKADAQEPWRKFARDQYESNATSKKLENDVLKQMDVDATTAEEPVSVHEPDDEEDWSDLIHEWHEA